MSFYGDMAATATSLLTEFGQPVVITKRTGTSYDISTGAMSVTTATLTGVGVVLDYGTKDIDNSMVRVGDKKLLLSVSGMSLPPNVDDLVTASGLAYTIINVMQLSPAGVTVMYKCNVRGA